MYFSIVFIILIVMVIKYFLEQNAIDYILLPKLRAWFNTTLWIQSCL